MTNQNQRIHISIDFFNTALPVINCDDGFQRVPLKPIAEHVGVSWEVQRRKVSPDSYLWKRLGAEITTLKGGEMQGKQGNPTHVCIRIDRVTAYLNTINPQNIRGMGNDAAANWLEEKHSEWDDALNAYETYGVAHKKSNDSRIVQLTKLFTTRNATRDPKEQAALTALIHRQFAELGQPLEREPDLFNN